LCGAREQPAKLIHQAEFEDVVGAENICENVQEALRRAEEVYEGLEGEMTRSTPHFSRRDVRRGTKSPDAGAI